ncbi:hypothetical protein NXS98_14300 [Fontisphaera persica]|uniref:hypothetical protein n=1 Tax=Fontisphaera persica TaxID=2974023 RepID=UPI0024BF12C3|nr:hypothetical protein [Fontisphaera persica]WCJ58880.1 hypothetical protein NXS98_14300 [Fontisphaera persica]
MPFPLANTGEKTNAPVQVKTEQNAPFQSIFPPSLKGQPEELLAQALAQAAQALAQAAQALTGAHLPSHLPPPHSHPHPLQAAANEFLIAKARAGLTRHYLQSLRWSLSHFLEGWENLLLHEIKPADIEEFITSPAWNNTTRKNVITDLRTFFSWCQRRGLAATNPALAVDKPRPSDHPPGIHTPEQVRRILDLAYQRDRDLMRLLAIQYFAGPPQPRPPWSPPARSAPPSGSTSPASAPKTPRKSSWAPPWPPWWRITWP